jgi:hypothetical protein
MVCILYGLGTCSLVFAVMLIDSQRTGSVLLMVK